MEETGPAHTHTQSSAHSKRKILRKDFERQKKKKEEESPIMDRVEVVLVAPRKNKEREREEKACPIHLSRPVFLPFLLLRYLCD